MGKKRERKKGYETYQGKATTACLCCRKKIRREDTCFVVRNIDDNKVVARHCSETCDGHYMLFGPCGVEGVQPNRCPTPAELNDIEQNKLHELSDRWVTDEETPE